MHGGLVRVKKTTSVADNGNKINFNVGKSSKLKATWHIISVFKNDLAKDTTEAEFMHVQFRWGF